MGFGFGKKKKNMQTEDISVSDMQTKLDESGNVEIISKNFKMKPTPKPADDEKGSSTWICWGCGQPTDQNVCPICGKKRIK